MKPLHVALIVKNTPASFERERRNMGMFSYGVPEFTWEHLAPGKGTTISTREWKVRGFDLIFQEDGGAWSEFHGHALPIVYYSIDSTLSRENHYQPRFEQACRADLVLLDHDRAERFEQTGRPVRRLLYAVNDRLFLPSEKTLDVDFQCGGSVERARMRVLLSELCQRHGWSYKSGTAALDSYAASMNAARVVVTIPRTPINRPHRVYDAMASGAALLSAPLPDVSGETFWAGEDYEVFSDSCVIEEKLTALLSGSWQTIAERGRQYAAKQTWAVRAAELSDLLAKELMV